MQKKIQDYKKVKNMSVQDLVVTKLGSTKSGLIFAII